MCLIQLKSLQKSNYLDLISGLFTNTSAVQLPELQNLKEPIIQMFLRERD